MKQKDIRGNEQEKPLSNKKFGNPLQVQQEIDEERRMRLKFMSWGDYKRIPIPIKWKHGHQSGNSSDKLGFPCQVGTTARIMTCMFVEGLTSQFEGI